MVILWVFSAWHLRPAGLLRRGELPDAGNPILWHVDLLPFSLLSIFRFDCKMVFGYIVVILQ
jgi:hypothetical protein